MLPLDDSEWNELQGNYGTGTTVAKLLSDARAGDPLGQWYDPVFQELLHQYTLSQVAYAAVPHLVDIASKRPETRMHLMVLVGGCYAHSTDPEAPAIPAHLEEEWRAAQESALSVILRILEDPQLSENDVRYLLSSLAAIKGLNALSIAIEAFETEVECPHCSNWIDLGGSQPGGSSH